MFKGKLADRAIQVRLLRFLFVGGISAVVQFIALWLLKRYLSAGFAFSLSFCCSTSTHYFLNRCWALPSGRKDPGRQFGEYLATVGLSYLINLGGFRFFHDIVGFDVMWSAAWAIPPSTLVVFLLLHYRVFSLKAG